MTPKTTIKYKGVDIPIDVYQKMLDNGVLGEKHDTVQSTFAQVPHGYSQQWTTPPEGGILSRPGVDPRMFSAVPSLPGRLLEVLPLRRTRLISPEYQIFTAIDDPNGTNPTNFCGTPPVTGNAKVATTRAKFGKYFMGTPKITLNEIGGRINNADVDRQLVNNMAMMSKYIPDAARAGDINTTLGLNLLKLGVTNHRKFSITLFQGNSQLSNSSTELGFIEEFDGFDELLVTGYTDLDSGTAAPAADSLIETFSNSDATVGSNGIVELVSSVCDRLEDRAQKAGFEGFTYGMAMTKNLFRALTLVWPTSYLTTDSQVTNANGQRIMVTGSENVTMRDEMYNGKFLWVYGKRIPVFIEDGIAETTGGVGFRSTIYFIPLTVGLEQVTYMEHFDQGNAEIQEFLALTGGTDYRTTNDGLFAVTMGQSKFCYEWFFAAQPRLICRTPYLGARITNVEYKLTNGYYRDALPGAPYYDGGGTYVSTPYIGAT